MPLAYISVNMIFKDYLTISYDSPSFFYFFSFCLFWFYLCPIDEDLGAEGFLFLRLYDGFKLIFLQIFF